MPLKALHLGDVHMGMENYGRIDPISGLHSRLQDFSRCLHAAIDTALEEQVDLVLFAGDAYRTCDPNPTHQREFAAAFRRLEDARIPTVMITGNHDHPVSFGRASSLDIFNTLGMDNLHVVSKPKWLLVQTQSGPVQVACLPWPTRSTLMTRDEYKELSEEEIALRIQDICQRIIANMAEDLDSALPSFLLAHITAAEAILSGTERSAMVGRDPSLLTGVLANPTFDYVALGHIHKFQDLNPRGNPSVVYCGSLERIDFGEEKEDKGFCLVTIEQGNTSYRFISTPARPFVTIKVEVSDDEDPTVAILREIQKTDLNDAVVRVIYTVSEERESLVNLKAIRSALDPAFLVASIVRRTEPVRKMRRTEITTDLNLREALNRYLENHPDWTPFAEDMHTMAQQLEQELEQRPKN